MIPRLCGHLQFQVPRNFEVTPHTHDLGLPTRGRNTGGKAGSSGPATTGGFADGRYPEPESQAGMTQL
jgi:hypothetical protein